MDRERIITAPELRAEGRRIEALAMRYGEVSPSHREYFAGGALRPDGDVWLNLEHDGERVVAWRGSGLDVEATRSAVRFRAEVPRTPAGDAALEGIRTGARRGVSIEFSAVQERRDERLGLRRVEDALLHGFGLVRAPSYPSAEAETRRSRTGGRVSGSTPLGKALPCRCKSGCQSIRIEEGALDEALSARGERTVTAFMSGRFSEPLAATGGGGLKLRREGAALYAELDGLTDNAAAEAFLASHDTGFWTVRPWMPEATSIARREGATYVVEQGDLRAVELALVTGETGDLVPLTVREGRRRSGLEPLLWL